LAGLIFRWRDSGSPTHSQVVRSTPLGMPCSLGRRSITRPGLVCACRCVFALPCKAATCRYPREAASWVGSRYSPDVLFRDGLLLSWPGILTRISHIKTRHFNWHIPAWRCTRGSPPGPPRALGVGVPLDPFPISSSVGPFGYACAPLYASDHVKQRTQGTEPTGR
jgi:hypothetical protein